MPLKTAISGSTGLVGSFLADQLKLKGHQIIRVVRRESQYDGDDPCVMMDVAASSLAADKLEGCDIVIHLAGAGIADHKWTPEYKRTIYSSRVDSTKLIASTLASLKQKPKVFLSASAIGFYGSHQADDIVDERTPLGGDYLAQVCQHWEAATEEAIRAGIRTVHMRLGVVLSKKGGALAKMLPAFKLGLGGKLGSGEQMMSWIAAKEIPDIIEHIIDNESLQGPINFVSPQPLSNGEFTKILGKALHRPAFLPAPGFAIRMVLGEMGDTLLLKGARVIPKALQDSHYTFKYPDLDSALGVALKN